MTWPRLPAPERGRRLAAELGCFACHGPDGTRGAANPGRSEGSVPNFEGDVMMYARDAAQIRAWIVDGVPAARAASGTWRAQRDAGLLVMPAYGDRLADAQVDDLVAFVLAASGEPKPPDGPAAEGRARAKDLGCFGCHGAGGRFAPPNTGSLKGYVPAWDGEDWPELVRDRAEFDAWVLDGAPPRLRDHPVAAFLLGRQFVAMPAYRDHLAPGDLDRLWAYVSWLRDAGSASGGGSPAPGTP